MDHNRIMVDGCLNLIEREILRKDDRPRECSIVALFHEHAFCIEVDRCVITFSGESEDIPREGDIDLTRIDSCYGCDDDDLLSEIEYIDGYLSYIDLMIMGIMYVYLYRLMRLVSFSPMYRLVGL
jgi:hypothetical protein